MRYFTKIDERDINLKWDFKENNVFITLNKSHILSPFYVNNNGNLFVVLEQFEENKFKVLFLSESSEGMLEHFDVEEFSSKDAYRWAYYIGNREIMINKITESDYAYFWARDIGNKDVMIDRITASVFAYRWALNIGNREIMIERITDSEHAFYWALKMGNRDIMIDRITEPEYAYRWAVDIGDKEIMKEKITDKYWSNKLNNL